VKGSWLPARRCWRSSRRPTRRTRAFPGLRAQLTQGRAELEQGRAELEKGIAELAAGRAAYEDGVAISRATEGTRLVSEDGRYAVAQVQFDTDAQSVPVENRAMIPDSAKAALAAAGVNADYSVEITQDTALIGAGEIIGLTSPSSCSWPCSAASSPPASRCSSRCSASASASAAPSPSRR
jgi:hypothetical protein